MFKKDNVAYFRRREAQELSTSKQVSDPLARRLHWEMAQQYAARANREETRK